MSTDTKAGALDLDLLEKLLAANVAAAALPPPIVSGFDLGSLPHEAFRNAVVDQAPALIARVLELEQELLDEQNASRACVACLRNQRAYEEQDKRIADLAQAYTELDIAADGLASSLTWTRGKLAAAEKRIADLLAALAGVLVMIEMERANRSQPIYPEWTEPEAMIKARAALGIES